MHRPPSRVRSALRIALTACPLIAIAPMATAAEIHVMISGGFTAAYDELVPLYEKASGNRVVTERGPSTGDTPQAIPSRLARGEAADLVILIDAGLDGLVAKRLAVDGSRVDIAKADIYMAVKAGTRRPDISSVGAFTDALQNAKSIAYADSPSGMYLEKTLFPKIDPNGNLRVKSRMIPAEPVGEVVARGDAEIGFQQQSELQPVKGITIVGPIPSDVQKTTTYVAGIPSNAKEPDAARDFVRFLTSRAAQPAIIKSGMEPVSATMTKAPPDSAVAHPPDSAEMTKEPVPKGK